MTAVAAGRGQRLGTGLRFDRQEAAGAFGDLGVLVPIAVAMIVVNGLSATAVIVPAGLLYIVAGLVFGVPVPVQPLKAFGAIAIALQLGAAEIAAGAILLGGTFLVLGASGLLDRAARLFPRPLVRGIQLAVGVLFLEIAAGLVTDPPSTFADHAHPAPYLLAGALAVAVAAVALRRHGVTLALVGVAVAVMAWRGAGVPAPELWGPSPLRPPELSVAAFAAAATTLVLPQLPLTFANSCLGTADAARTYFGDRARRVRPGRLAVSLGAANIAVGLVGGMPLCHGAGGLTAHRAFGARTGGAPVIIGAVLVALGLGLGAGLAGLLAGFPLAVLAGLLAVAGALHIGLLRDLGRPAEWLVALGVGVLGVLVGLGPALVAGLLTWWAVLPLVRRAGARRR